VSLHIWQYSPPMHDIYSPAPSTTIGTWGSTCLPIIPTDITPRRNPSYRQPHWTTATQSFTLSDTLSLNKTTASFVSSVHRSNMRSLATLCPYTKQQTLPWKVIVVRSTSHYLVSMSIHAPASGSLIAALALARSGSGTIYF